MFASFPGACRSPSPRTRVVWNGRPPSSEPSPGPGRIQSWSDIMVESPLVIKCSPTWWFALCRASNSKQDLRSLGGNHSRGFSLHILRHRIIIRALHEWTPSPAGVLTNSALDQRLDNLGGGPCLKSFCPVEAYPSLTPHKRRLPAGHAVKSTPWVRIRSAGWVHFGSARTANIL